MKKILSAILLMLFMMATYAQQSPGEAAKKFIRQGDYANAILVLNRAIENDGGNLELQKDLAFAYYLQRDYGKALATIRPVTENRSGDIQSFQIQGMIYEAMDDRRGAERTYKAGIKRYRSSGALYNEYGELAWSNTNYMQAVEHWLKGIQNEPNYPGNYYNAAKYYYMSPDKVWGLIYGEIFINLESFSKRTPEIKTLLLEGYKKLFSETDMTKEQDMKNDFVEAYLQTMKSQSAVVAQGINPDALSVLRTRFILEWFPRHSAKIPFRLFEYHRQLARSGLFEAYNQWIFGAAHNLSSFQQWTVTHPDEYKRFNEFQKSRVFKLPDGQYYNRKP